MDTKLIDMQPMVALARKLQTIVEAQQYDEIWSLLDKISVPEGFQLGIERCKEEGTGSNSFVTLTFPDGHTIRNNADDSEFWTYLSFEDSPMGAWQACLLKNLWHYLPLFWHALYVHKDYMYEREQLDKIPIGQELNECRLDKDFKEFNPSEYDIAPTIRYKGQSTKGNCYEVSMCSWASFGGLHRWHDDVFISHGKLFFISWQGTCLYKYRLGLRY